MGTQHQPPLHQSQRHRLRRRSAPCVQHRNARRRSQHPRPGRRDDRHHAKRHHAVRPGRLTGSQTTGPLCVVHDTLGVWCVAMVSTTSSTASDAANIPVGLECHALDTTAGALLRPLPSDPRISAGQAASGLSRSLRGTTGGVSSSPRGLTASHGAPHHHIMRSYPNDPEAMHDHLTSCGVRLPAQVLETC